MKKTYTLLIAAFLAISSLAQGPYPGNNGTSAGGPVGTGNVTLSDDGNRLNVIFTKGAASLTGIVVMYIQHAYTKTQIRHTDELIPFDNTDRLQQAMCGKNVAGETAGITFTAGFRPNYAIAFQPGDATPRAEVAELRKDEPFGNPASPPLVNGSNPDNPTFELNVNLKDIGIKVDQGDDVAFQFLVYYIDPASGRSNESIGDPMTSYPTTTGWNDYATPGTFLTYEGTLPVVFGDFTGAFAGKNVQLNWNTKTEINTKQFDVQKSGDGAIWRSIATMSTQNSATGARYSYLDNNVADAVTYYQIKLTDIDGAISYSPVIIMRKDAVSGITLLGNPARGVINLNISNTNAGKYNIELYSVDGRRIGSQVYNHTGGSGKVSIAVPGEVKGTCVVRITNGNEKQSIKVVVQ